MPPTGGENDGAAQQRSRASATTPRGKCRRLGHGLIIVVAALGLIAIGALGATLVPRYLSGAPPTPVATAPTPPLTAPSASEPPAESLRQARLRSSCRPMP